MTLTQADIRFLLTKLGIDTGQSLIRPGQGFSAEDVWTLIEKLKAEVRDV